MTLSLRSGAVSDIGRRKKNDDSGYAGTHFVMVADGMGGAPAGDLASTVAVQAMQDLDTPPPADILDALAAGLASANEQLTEILEEDSSVEGMGTTVTAVLFDGHRIGVAHLGDSRGYLWRDGELQSLTSDHTWVQSLVDEGRITADEAKTHSHRSLLLKVLDGRHDTQPDLSVVEVQAGDRIMLCSDGLCGFVSEDQIAHVLSAGDAGEVAAELTQLALDEHSTDNVTVVVADVVEEPFVEQTPAVVGAAADETPGRFSRLRHWTQRDHAVPTEALIEPGLDPEELRYAPREPSRYRWVKRTVAVVVVLGLLFATGAVAYSWTQDQYYVSEYDGKVAIYQGIQADLPGVDLHSVYRVHDLTLDELPNFRRSQVIEGMTADNLEDAERIVAQLDEFANRCARQAATPPSTTRNGSPRATTDASGATGNLTTPTTTREEDTTEPEGGTGTAGQSDPGTTPTRRTGTAPSTTAATTDGTETGSDDECAGVEPETGTTR